MDYFPYQLDYFLRPISAAIISLSVFIGLIGLALGILILVFLGRDASRRNMNIAGWIILAIFTGFWGSTLYLLVRGPIVVEKASND